MSRSGYTDDDCDQWAFIRWRGQVVQAIRGKRGQAFLRELVEALDAMPKKRLIARALIIDAPPSIPPDVPQVCAIGALGLRRGVNLAALDPEDYDAVADTFGIAHQLVREIEWMNDEMYRRATPEARWLSMRQWAAGLIKDAT